MIGGAYDSERNLVLSDVVRPCRLWQGFICGMPEAAMYGGKVAPSVPHGKPRPKIEE